MGLGRFSAILTNGFAGLIGPIGSNVASTGRSGFVGDNLEEKRCRPSGTNHTFAGSLQSHPPSARPHFRVNPVMSTSWIMNLILQWHLDVILFGVLTFTAVLIADRLCFSRSFNDRKRGGLRSSAAIMILASIYLAVGRGETERMQLRHSVDGFATMYADEMREHGHGAVELSASADNEAYLFLIKKQLKWLWLSPAVADIYTMRMDSDGTVRIIVDSETDYDKSGQIDSDREKRRAIGEVYEKVSPVMLAAFQGDSLQTYVDDVPYPDRWGMWVSSFAPILDSEGKVEAVVGVDFSAEEWISSILWARASVLGFATALILTVLTTLNHELVKARDSAEQASRSKSEFLANMSHEIRTPMNGILGLTELMLQSQITVEQRRSLELVVSSGEALMTVLNDILDFSKIEANMLHIDRTEFEPREIVGDAMKLLGFRAEERGLELTCRILPAVPRAVLGDAGRIRQVLVNLVGNAIKFTHRGEVAVTVAECISDSGRRDLVFSVRDTGIGISEDRQRSIFEAFVQADGSTTRHYGGTGLGLAICTRLVNLMGGEIWLKSTPGQGSTFSFRIPCEVSSAEHAAAVELMPGSIPRQHVLVVDDNPTNRLIMEEVLAAWRMDVVSVDHGRHVRNVIETAHKEGNPVSLVLLDVHMPDMDGFAVAEIVSSLKCANELPVIMLSSSDAAHHRQTLSKVKIAAWLTKPVKQSELLETILALNTPDQEKPAGSECDRQIGSPLKQGCRGHLLVAEDNDVNQQLVTRVLSRDGYRVTIAKDGAEAVRILGSERFDAVLMDCQMPKMDGYEATRNIRQAGRTSRAGHRLPIIALTANAMAGDRDKCLAAGMDDFVTKPLSFKDLYETLSRHLQLPPITAAAEVVVTGAKPAELQSENFAAVCTAATDVFCPTLEDAAPAPSSSFGTALTCPVLDRGDLIRRVGGDEELIGILAEAFREDTLRHLAAFNAALQAEDCAAAKNVAHTIKGCAGNLSGMRLSEFAKSVEQSVAAGNLTEAKVSLPQLEQEMNALLDAIDALASSFGRLSV